MTDLATETKTAGTALLDKEGKYLTFALAQEQYGLEILKVREIIGYMEITAVPQTPSYVKGVINLRGQVIPVIDLRAKFGMATTDVTEQTCIIVVEITQGSRKFDTGIVVDRVEEVLDIAGKDIEAAPQFGASVDTSFILGMGKIGDSVKILLDIDKVLVGADLSDLTRTTQGPEGNDTQGRQEGIAVVQAVRKDRNGNLKGHNP
jgi:purine-binding chemotaxis protein CheW